jgi:hypothetical protein
VAEVDEQRRIASAIKLADDAVRYAQQKVVATRQFKLSVMSELFARGLRSGCRDLQATKLGFIPADWTVSELRSIWTGSANGLYVPEEHYGSGIPIVRIDAFNDGFFESQSFKRIRVKREDVEAFALQPGDLLLNRVNSIPFLGKVAYVEVVPEFTVFESNMMRLRFASHELAKYLSLYLSVPATKKRIWAMKRSCCCCKTCSPARSEFQRGPFMPELMEGPAPTSVRTLFNEETTVEREIIEHLKAAKLGWTWRSRDYLKKYRPDEREVLLLPLLREKLKALNPAVLTDDSRVDAIITKLLAAATTSNGWPG